MAMTADRLLAGIKRRVTIPSNQILMEDTDFLAIADDMISSRIVPLMESVNQDYLVTRTTEALVASQSEYSIPYRAVGRALRELKIADSSGNVRNLPLISLEDSHTYAQSTLSAGFYFLGDKIRLVPDIPSSLSSDTSLEMWYRLPPSKLVTVSSAALVTVVNDPNVTVSNVPSTIITGSVIDFVQGKSGSSLYAIDETITNVSGTTITFGAGVIPSSLAAGDYISLAGYSPVINFVPNECYSLIEGLVAQRVLKAIGDFEGARDIAEDIAEDIKNIKMLLEPRIDGEPTIIINRSSLVRGSKFLSNRHWMYGE
jgi:hypothetical protein